MRVGQLKKERHSGLPAGVQDRRSDFVVKKTNGPSHSIRNSNVTFIG